MAWKRIEDSELTSIADEIRTMAGTTNLMKLDEIKSKLVDTNSMIGEQASLIGQIQSVVDNLPDAEGGEVVLQSKTVTPSANLQTVVADSGYDGLEEVIVNAIPSEYVQPSFTKVATTYTPTTTNQTIAAGTYLTGAQTIQGDANLIASNIVSGKTIFGITGTAESGGGSFETANVLINIPTPVPLGNEKLYYTSVNGPTSILLMDYELNSVTITCVIPSIITVGGISIDKVSGDISAQEYGVYFVTGSGSLVTE